MDLKCSYTLDLSCPNRQRPDFSENVKFIAVTSRASKLQVFKVLPGQDLNPGHAIVCIHFNLSSISFVPMLSDSRGWPGFKSRPGQTSKTCNFEALEVTAMYFTFLETSNLFLFGQERSSMICYQEYPFSKRFTS